ncbi:PAS domain S-box protein [Thioalkalivibrio versutus]|uniref:sensor domain-containing diguanylate cyclase n=1 Tax=Thioalkalivibrio versutus TaxID=106634 RepID=UPI00035D6762|nr:PAS domain S-box protein [Thioalkalivibrio versutus]OOC49213.1 sensor domain-containing diguanylate cyclase [Thioalkalivibrio versutus]
MSEICAIHGYAALFEHAPVGLAEMDTEGRILRANPRLGALLACDPADLADAILQDYVCPDDRERCAARRHVLLNGDCSTSSFEARLLDATDQAHWVELAVSRIPATEDCPEALLVAVADIGVRKETEQRTETLLRASPAVIYTMDPSDFGTMTWLSPNVQAVTGWAPEQVTGQPDWLQAHLAREDYQRCAGQVKRWLADGARGFCRLSYRQRMPSGHWQWLEDQVTAIRDGQGAVVELVGAFQDVGAREETERHLEKIAHNLPGVIYQYRQYPDGRASFPYASEGMADVYGVTPEAVMLDARRVFDVIHPDDVERVAASIEASMRCLESWRQRYRVRHPERGEIWVEGHASPEALEDGSVLWFGVILDITERVQAEEVLHLRERELAEAQRIAHIGNWVSDFVRNEVRWSDEVFRIFGMSRGEWGGTHEAFMHAVHPGDRERVQAEVDASLGGDGALDIVHRVLRPDGDERVVHERGYVEFDAAGRVQRMIGTVQDITERHHLEQEQRLLAATFDSSQAIFITDVEGTIQRVNATFAELTGFTEEDAVGQNPRIMNSGRQDRGFYDEMFQSVRENGHWSGEVWNRRKDGRIFPLHEIVTAIRDASGVIEYYIAMFHDISRQKELEAALEYQAFYDTLTDAANRGHFEALLEQEARRAERYADPCSLVMLDLDHFKRINDTHGHDIGDEVLRRVVATAGERLRQSDVLGRWGGEEFMVMLPSTRAEDACRLAEDLRRQVAALDLPRVGQVTISLGVAECRRGEAIKDWIKRADDAMYRAKHSGRNRVVWQD